jgi:hypothetical protein
LDIPPAAAEEGDGMCTDGEVVAAADLPVAALWIAADVPGFTGDGTGTGKYAAS